MLEIISNFLWEIYVLFLCDNFVRLFHKNVLFSTKIVKKITGIRPGGGGYLVYLSDGDASFLRISFWLIFLERGIERRQFLWSLLSKLRGQGGGPGIPLVFQKKFLHVFNAIT